MKYFLILLHIILVGSLPIVAQTYNCIDGYTYEASITVSGSTTGYNIDAQGYSVRGCYNESIINPGDFCTGIYEPVCGCDGKTYSNSCYANQEGYTVLTEGACDGSELIEFTISGLPSGTPVTIYINGSPTILEYYCENDDCSYPDIEPLIALFNSTNGINWTNNFGWIEGVEGTSCDPCNFNGKLWYGISCTNGRVTCIDLDGNPDCAYKSENNLGNNLDGFIPEEIGRLDQLQTVSFSNNNISGTLPSLSTLSNLVSFNCSSNKLAGPIPTLSANTSLRTLKFFDCSINQFNDSIPDLSKNVNLELFDCSSNQLTGSIPDLSKNVSLKTFHLQNNKINHIPKLIIPNLQKDLTNEPRGLRIFGNRVTFDDILSNIQIATTATFIYAPQDSIYQDTTFTLKERESLTIDLGIDASITTNVYKWYKNGVLVDSIVGSNRRVFTNLKSSDAGVWTCRVTNPGAPLLTLQSRRIIVAVQTLVQSCSQRDSLALVDFWEKAGGSDWINKWDLTKPMSTWYGIRLSAEGCVECIDMDGVVDCGLNIFKDGNNLVGSISEKINQLSNLKILILGSLNRGTNNLNGIIPTFSLPNLQILTLVNNNLTGEIPNFITPNLRDLNLGGNQLNGQIPNFDFPNLVSLDLDRNKLSGQVPNFNLTKLQSLDLAFNKLSDSIPKFNMPNLVQLLLSNNGLNGKIPNFNMPNLERLWLNNNELIGSIPNFTMPKLEIFHCYNNKLESIPKLTLTGLKRDLGFHAYNNRITFDDILPNIQYATTATFIYAPQDSIYRDTTFIRKEAESLIIDLGIDEGITTNVYKWYKNGTLVDSIVGSNKRIFASLNLSDAGVWMCRVTNPGVPLLTLQSRTITINVQPNCRPSDSLALIDFYIQAGGPNWTITWDLTERMDNWYGIGLNAEGCVECIDMSGGVGDCDISYFEKFGNNLVGHISGKINTLSELRNLNVSNNKLNGSIPSLSTLSNLESFNCSVNQLTGNIPDLSNNISLTDFFCGYNQLTDTIPTLSKNLNLTDFSCSNNQLTGKIPDLSMNLNLVGFSCDRNLLTGTIPDLSKNINLISFECNGNQLSGAIPDLSKNVNLQYFQCKNNQLTNNFFDLSKNINLLEFGCDSNRLTFYDILPNIQYTSASSYIYHPQDSIYRDTTLNRNEGESLSIDLGIDSAITTNVYTWYKNGVLVDSITGSNQRNFDKVMLSDAGVWTCSVANPGAPLLTLQSRRITVNIQTSCRLRDSLALVDFWEKAGGPNWANKWDLSIPMNTWYGIGLTTEGCVVCIDLDGSGGCSLSPGNTGNNLEGILSTSLDSLKNLQLLFLNGNNLGGKIPNLRLHNLIALDLNSNQFSDSIPNFNLPNLQDLRLYNNKLTGNIPQFNLPNLDILYVYVNKLSGDVPKFILPNLRLLGLDRNRFDGNISEQDFPKLQSFNLNRNLLTFEHILPNINYTEISNYDYSPQDSVYLDTTFTRNEGESLTIDLGIDAVITTNVYKWYKNAVFVDSIVGSSKRIFATLNLSDAGLWTCSVTNPLAPLLTLQSRKITIIVQPSCRLRDSIALVDFWEKAGGPNWTNKWDLTNPMSTWYGISLSAEGCVECIDLDGELGCVIGWKSGNNLIGTISNSVDSIKSLKYFSLSHNKLGDSIPNFNLPKLQILNLSWNQLNGSIPNFKLPNLEYLWLTGNQLNGSIPNLNFSKLQSLLLANNQLTDSIPNFILPKLQTLFLQNNQLRGSIPNFYMPDLTELYLFNNQLSGPIPNFNTPKLEYFHCYNNRLDSIPILNFSNLKRDTTFQRGFRAQNNRVTFDDILPNIQYATTATFIYSPQASIYRDTTFSRKAGESLTIDLGIDAAITTNVYKWYKNGILVDSIMGNNKRVFSSLKTEDAGIWTCKVTNANAPLLTLQSRNITLSVIPDPCGTHPDYATLDSLYEFLGGDKWTKNTGWKERKTASFCNPCSGWYGIECKNGRVSKIDLSNNKLAGRMSFQLILDSLVVFNIAGNTLIGSFPKLDKLPILEEFIAHSNGIDGSIPLLENNKNLRVLSVHSNKLNGFIPSLSNQKNLKIFHAYNNELIGLIPELSNLTNLESLVLYKNKLNGPLPDFRNNKLIKEVSLYENKLSGPLPDVSPNATLTTLLLNNNNFYGCYNQSLCGNNIEEINLLNNPQLPYEGDISLYCDNNSQLGAYCNDGNPDTQGDAIQDDCSCRAVLPECYIKLLPDIVKLPFDIQRNIDVTLNDSLPEAIQIRFSLPDLTDLTILTVNAKTLGFVRNGTWTDTISIPYEVCSDSCMNCVGSFIKVVADIDTRIVPVTVITPNGDGINDGLRFNDEPIILKSELKIFNRWGNQIYSKKEYENNWEAEGHPGGSYYYVLKVGEAVWKKNLVVIK